MSNAFSKLPWSSVSEFGVDYGFSHGRFNRLADEEEGDFNDYWWKEMCRFEEAMVKVFPDHKDCFGSGDTPYRREFVVWPEKDLPMTKLFESCLRYLSSLQPEASVCIASPLEFDLGCGRVALNTRQVWIDQDLVFWMLNTATSGLPNPTREKLFRNSHLVGLCNLHPWLNQLAPVSLDPTSFWKMVYGNQGQLTMESFIGGEAKAYRKHSEIVSKLCDKYGILDEKESCEVFLSHSSAGHRVVKVECTLKAFTPDLFEGALKIMRRVDESWALRFAVFENLIEEDCYCGGVMVLPSGEILAETGHSVAS
jgi:hypothetical protein